MKKDWLSEFDPFVGSYLKYQDQSHFSAPVTDDIKVIDSDIGRAVGFKRMAIHHIILPAGCRTSSPHAESHEEEFIFVIKGKPQLWLNGFIHDLVVGSAVGFPSGTGIAHTVINNTNEDVHLIVAGEKTKKENLCAFPIDPELKESSPIWWKDAPTRPLGPHQGRPGQVLESEKATEPSSAILHCESEPKGQPFHYPGDNETFGLGFRISSKVGLKALGIWYETLPAGRRSAFPHAHTHEDEFIFVLKGEPTVWLDGFVKKMKPDDFVAFPSNTGVNHTLINDTKEDVVYICIGEAADFPDEKITYPLHPLRIEECVRKNWYWMDAPTLPQGPHSGSPIEKFPEHMKFNIVTKSTDSTESQKDLDLEIILNDQLIGNYSVKLQSPDKDQFQIISFNVKKEFDTQQITTKCKTLLIDYMKRAHEKEIHDHS